MPDAIACDDDEVNGGTTTDIAQAENKDDIETIEKMGPSYFDKLRQSLAEAFRDADPTTYKDRIMSKEGLREKMAEDEARRSRAFVFPDEFTADCMADYDTLQEKIERDDRCLTKACELVGECRDRILAEGCIHPTPLSISTMVVQVKLCVGDASKINQKRLYSSMVTSETEAFIAGVAPEYKISYQFESDMHNVIMVLSMVPTGSVGAPSTGRKTNNVKVLVFKNGVLLVTGCVQVRESQKVMELSRKILQHALDCAVDVVSMEVVMVNSDFILQGHSLNLDKVNERLCSLRKENINVGYCLERHAAVIVKFGSSTMNTVTIMLFNTGSILITGFTKGADLRDAYVFIVTFLADHIDEVGYVNDVVSTGGGTKRKKARTSQGCSNKRRELPSVPAEDSVVEDDADPESGGVDQALLQDYIDRLTRVR